jgi:hypothetical protein
VVVEPIRDVGSSEAAQAVATARALYRLRRSLIRSRLDGPGVAARGDGGSFLVPFVVADQLVLRREIYLAVYVAFVAALFIGSARETDQSLRNCSPAAAGSPSASAFSLRPSARWRPTAARATTG